jgi:aldose 1-epimerase
VLEHILNPQPGYPFTLELTIDYVLGDDGLSVRTSARNAGDRACPFGAGAHPYLTLAVIPVDSLFLQVPAQTVLRSDDNGIPVGSAPVEGTDYDFREVRAIGSTALDHCFTDLSRGVDGLARAGIADADGRRIELWVDDRHTHLMVFTGDPLPDVNRRAVAIEPMTCPPNALQTGDGVIRLEVDEAVRLSWGLRNVTRLG